MTLSIHLTERLNFLEVITSYSGCFLPWGSSVLPHSSSPAIMFLKRCCEPDVLHQIVFAVEFVIIKWTQWGSFSVLVPNAYFGIKVCAAYKYVIGWCRQLWTRADVSSSIHQSVCFTRTQSNKQHRVARSLRAQITCCLFHVGRSYLTILLGVRFFSMLSTASCSQIFY